MDIEVIKKLIRKYQPGHSAFVLKALQERNYYENKTDILFPDLKKKKEQE